MTKNEALRYELSEASIADPKDLDYPEIEIVYEHTAGAERPDTICILGLCKRALERIEELEKTLTGFEKLADEMWELLGDADCHDQQPTG